MAWCLVKHMDNFTFTLPFTMNDLFHVKENEMSGRVGHIGEIKNVYKILVR
jgi:hypothetical protein